MYAESSAAIQSAKALGELVKAAHGLANYNKAEPEGQVLQPHNVVIQGATLIANYAELGERCLPVFNP